jgi:hypothetical protein
VSTRHAVSLALALGLAGSSASAAPMGAGVDAVGVMSLEADRPSDFAAKTLTNALRQTVLDEPEYTLNDSNASLLLLATEFKCPMGTSGRELPDERVFDDACLRKVGKFIGVSRLFWGYVTAGAGGGTVVRLHFWQRGQRERVATLPYEVTARDRIAARLYRKLVTPEKVGDVTLSGAAQGELVVDGRAQGSYAPGVELTLFAGEHAIEVRQGLRVVARASARVAAEARAEVQLKPVAEPVAAPPSRLPTEPPPVVIRPRPSAWPWVLGGTAVAGLAGAGVFWTLRQSERSDLAGACFDKRCPEREGDAVERGRTLTTLSAISLGVGVAAGAGLTAYLLTPRRALPVTGAVAPLPGGGVMSLWGSFLQDGSSSRARLTGRPRLPALGGLLRLPGRSGRLLSG